MASRLRPRIGTVARALPLGLVVSAVVPPAVAPAASVERPAFAGVPTRQAAQSTTITLRGAGWTALRGAGVRAAASGAARARGGARLTLPTGLLDVRGRRVTVDHEGALRLRRGDRTLTLDALQLRLGVDPALTARIDGRRRTIATVSGRPVVDAATGVVRLRRGSLRLTAAGAALLERTLGVRVGGARALGAVVLDLDAGSDLADGGMLDWGLSRELRGAADAGVARPGRAITVFDSAICVTDERRDEGCVADPTAGPLARPTRAQIYFPVIDGRWRAGRRRAEIEGQGGLRIVHPPSGRAVVVESPRVRISGATATLSVHLTVEAPAAPDRAVAQHELTLARFRVVTGPVRRGRRLAWTTGPGTLTAAAATALDGVLAPDARLDPLTVAIDAP